MGDNEGAEETAEVSGDGEPEEVCAGAVEEEESCEGWVYDKETGYWIQCAEEDKTDEVRPKETDNEEADSGNAADSSNDSCENTKCDESDVLNQISESVIDETGNVLNTADQEENEEGGYLQVDNVDENYVGEEEIGVIDFEGDSLQGQCLMEEEIELERLQAKDTEENYGYEDYEEEDLVIDDSEVKQLQVENVEEEELIIEAEDGEVFNVEVVENEEHTPEQRESMGEAEGQLEITEDAAIEETSTTNETDLEEVKHESSEVGSECLSDSMTSQPPDTSTALDVKEDTEKQNTATDEKLFEGTHQSKIRKKIKIKVTVTESSEQVTTFITF